ncbi:type VII secretion-associated serine protease mycosin [Mycolicibacterium sp. BiH015]|uniref:type VII secretion-associated serine protease mycosin n=1 Tax=Mycolicibacterium sp. BiH015 TaxID=3018808 RepID=UPI0022E1A3B7|nr:type VII secretion-associated serine protease mycosin [Mycolicibacterium sp. BiH015]MDA2895000.1 type VII secretion-associated serine protease mycosin [Mycolicibacterium sp. BiH015]
MSGRLCRVLAASAILVVQSAPTAHAVSPPAVDERRLPDAGPPAPAHPTAQHDECATAPPAATAEPGQLGGMDLSSVWALTRGAGQTVAVIDTGVTRHRRLPHLVPGGDYVSRHDGTNDCDGHGTIVAGIIGATPDAADPEGFTGIAPDASVLSIRQSSNKFHAIDDPGGTGVGDVATLAAAVRTAADLGATVINISTVACVPVDAVVADEALGAALSYAVDVKNVVVITAAGNVGGPGQCRDHNPRDAARAEQVSTVASPAWYDDLVLTVGSVAANGTPSDFSLAGPWVDVAAPGEGVVSLASAGDGLVDVSPSGAPLSGTSYAVPVVSAVAALVRARSPELTARQVMQRIEDTAHAASSGWNPAIGHGVVDPLAAVSGPGVSPSTPRAAAPIDAGQPVRDPAPARTALRGAALCFALTACVAALSGTIGRLTRRLDSTRVPGAASRE